jgi:hypothetical protein
MKETKDLFNENYKPLKREIKEDIRRSPMLMDDSYTTKSNEHVKHNPYQNSNDILHRNRKINLEILMETGKTSNSQSNSEQKVQC